MSRAKVTAEERIEAAKACAEGRISQAEAARRLGISRPRVTEWVARYNGKYELIFRNITMNSSYEQVILIGMHSFSGTICLNGEPVKFRKAKHDGFFIYEKDARADGSITLSVDYRGGIFFIQSDMLGWTTDITFQRKGLVNTAMIAEILHDNTYRFYCNDKEYDDDFDDLIFDLEIREIG